MSDTVTAGGKCQSQENLYFIHYTSNRDIDDQTATLIRKADSKQKKKKNEQEILWVALYNKFAF